MDKCVRQIGISHYKMAKTQILMTVDVRKIVHTLQSIDLLSRTKWPNINLLLSPILGESPSKFTSLIMQKIET